MKALKNLKKSQRALLLTGFYAVLALIISSGILYYLNNYYRADSSNAEYNITNIKSIAAATEKNASQKLSVPVTAKDISFSEDNKYCMYLYNGSIYVREVETDRLIQKIVDKLEIKNAVLLKDRNLILYFTITKTPVLHSESLNMKTYNIDNDKNTLQQTFSISEGSKLKAVQYSSLTNLIVINIERTVNKQITNKLYYVNIMKKVRGFAADKIVNNMVLESNALSLYYQNGQNILYCNDKKIKDFENKRIRLLGRNGEDNIYLQDLNQKNVIYVLNNEKLLKIIKLSDGNYSKAVLSGDTIYLVYKTYAVNLTADVTKKIEFNRNLDFVNIVNNKLYLRNAKNSIIIDNAKS